VLISPEQLTAAAGANADVAAPAMRAVNLTLGFGAKTVLDEESLRIPLQR
jgi:phosphate transport system ATP-binding protein